MLKNAIMLLVVLGVLSYFKIDITAFAAILAAMGFAIGMALQGVLSNFAAGVMLLVFRPFKVGDYIIVDGTQGKVDEIDLFTTKLNSLDNRHLIVPNGTIFGATIENTTRNLFVEWMWKSASITPPTLVLLERYFPKQFQKFLGLSQLRPPEAYLMNLGDSSVNLAIACLVSSVGILGSRQRITESAKLHLDAAKISIPFPQMDLHFKDLDQIVKSTPQRKAA